VGSESLVDVIPLRRSLPDSTSDDDTRQLHKPKNYSSNDQPDGLSVDDVPELLVASIGVDARLDILLRLAEDALVASVSLVLATSVGNIGIGHVGAQLALPVLVALHSAALQTMLGCIQRRGFFGTLPVSLEDLVHIFGHELLDIVLLDGSVRNHCNLCEQQSEDYCSVSVEKTGALFDGSKAAEKADEKDDDSDDEEDDGDRETALVNQRLEVLPVAQDERGENHHCHAKRKHC